LELDDPLPGVRVLISLASKLSLRDQPGVPLRNHPGGERVEWTQKKKKGAQGSLDEQK